MSTARGCQNTQRADHPRESHRTAPQRHDEDRCGSRRGVFITSANFTEAAQSRNIEVGVLLRQPTAAARLFAYFDGLMSTGILHQIPSIDLKSAGA
jgi:hypothetical protein